MGPLPLSDTAYLRLRRGKRRSGNQYYVRVAVPLDLREQFGASTIERSLRTSNLGEAKRLRHTELAQIFDSFERARRKAITSADIEQEAQRYLRERIATIRENPGDAFQEVTDDDGNEYGLGALPRLDELNEGLASGEWDALVEREADAIERRYGVTLGKEQRHELCRALHLAEYEALSRLVKIHEGQSPEPIGVLNAIAVNPVTGALPPAPLLYPKKGTGIRVHEAAAAFIEERARPKKGGWTKQTCNQASATLRLFEEFTRNAPLQSITRADVASFLATLSRFDPSYGRRSGHGKLTLAQLSKRYAADGPGLSAKTLNRHADILANLFSHATKIGTYNGDNPAKGHHRSKARYDSAEGTRRPFTIDELTKLFAGPLFATLNGERICPTLHTPASALAWLVPAALFSGARLDELCGLRVCDVAEEDGVRFFDIQSHDRRRLKSPAARRRIPIHSELVRLGFLEYVESVRKQGHDMLFPGLSAGGPDSKRSWYISRKFLEYRKSVGAGANGTVFHSLRKNAATALERARIPEGEAARVLGHQITTMSYGVYSGGLDLPGLQRVVEAIRYPGLDLSRLFRQPLKTPKAPSKTRRARQSKSPALATGAH